MDACPLPPFAPEDSQEKTLLHLHRPDLGCSDEQENGEEEEQQEQDPNHLEGSRAARCPGGARQLWFPSPDDAP